jgi:F420H(2)-dependent quinone reductase
MTIPQGEPAPNGEQARRRMRAKQMRVLNVAMRRVLGLPFPTPLSKQLMLLYLTGRRTGKSYRQPVSYIRHDDTLLTPGGGKWKLNLQQGRPEKIRLRGQIVLARPDLVADIDEIDSLLAVMTAANPRVAGFIPILRHSDGHFDQGQLQVAVEHGFRIVRWHLEQPVD